MPDIELVIQWRLKCDMCTLWQRLGRAARDRLLQGTAIVFVDKTHFDSEREKSARRKVSAEARARKPKAVLEVSEPHSEPFKRQRTVSDTALEEGNTQLTIPTTLEMITHSDLEEEVVTRPNEDELELEEGLVREGEAEDELPESGLNKPDDIIMEFSADSEQFTPPTNNSKLLEARRTEYVNAARMRKAIQPKPTQSRRKIEPLAPELQDFVNAAERGLGCRRVPVQLTFNSDKAGE